MIHYIYYNAQAGQLRFNFINYFHNILPFEAKTELVETEEEIIEKFLKIEPEMYVDKIIEASH